MEIFERFGILWLLRWWHVLFGITWIGLLYYFNFVQGPAFAKMDPAHRNGATDQLVPRALWWFRWAAAATAVSGLLIVGFQDDMGDYFKGGGGTAINGGMLLGLTMLANVWMFIWPNQRIVIANARAVMSGGQPLPNAAEAARRGLLASRTNTLFSIPMVMFMTGASHFFPAFDPEGGTHILYWIIFLVVWAAIEANALGYIGGLNGQFTKYLEQHTNVIVGGIAYAVILYILWEILLG